MTEPTVATDIEEQAAKLAATTGLDVDTVRTLLHAQDQQQGEPIGTLRGDPEGSGAIAHRVMDRDVAKWRISHPTDGVVYEMSPTKADWPLIER